MQELLLRVRDLSVAFSSEYGKRHVTDGISFDLHRGEIFGLVGESGCGKSITALSLMGLLPPAAHMDTGSITFNGMELAAKSEKELDSVRGRKMAMIFQDPLSALNPVLSIGSQMTEGMRLHLRLDRTAARARAIALLTRVGLPDAQGLMKKYPHMLSGGMRQRVMIAMALSCEPQLLIADEPTTALDVTTQARIMQLLRSSVREQNISMLLITHDLGLVAGMCDRVAVMYAGQIVEQASTLSLFDSPAHPYTRMLLQSVPALRGTRAHLQGIPGALDPDYGHLPGCRFAPRCPRASDDCTAPQRLHACGEEQAVRCCHPFPTLKTEVTI